MRAVVVAPVVLCFLLVACERNPTAPPGPARAPFGLASSLATTPTESAAADISANVQAAHLLAEFPNPTIVDPRFASGDPEDEGYATVVGYAHAGDAAIWTGHYLAAEALRFAATKSPAALGNAERSLAGIQGLVDVTAAAMPRNPGLLARFLWPDSWWYGSQMAIDEGSHGVYPGTASGAPHRWLGNTSRDQYSGVFFGLAVAYDAFALIDDPTRRDANRNQIRALVTRMLDFLLRNAWSVRMPNGTYSTTFLNRPDQQLTLLQIGRHVNPRRYELLYRLHRAFLAPNVITPVAAECQDPHGSYYKFNLDHINLYNLIRLERDLAATATYMVAFDVLRGCTAGRQPTPPRDGCPNPDHQNPHFNMIERGLKGPDPVRDGASSDYLGLWLERQRRDYYVDHGDKYGVCSADRARQVIPVNDRVNTDFLWQRSPFLIRPDRRGEGTIETPGIDYLLPYWMGRYYGVITQ